MKPHLSPASHAGPLVFLSGQLGFHQGHITGDITRQTQQTLANIEATLIELGLARTDVVKTTVWLAHPDDFRAFDTAHANFFGAHKPARSTVSSRLMLPEALVEIETVACRPGEHA
jgi:2-iminobutanoate/2-iminopropanoate deaminase